MTGLPPSPRSATQARRSGRLIDFLGLQRYADEFVSNLSTGTRRIVDSERCSRSTRACSCSMSPPVVSRSEAEAFGPLIVRVQAS
jgi:hypothetical protein